MEFTEGLFRGFTTLNSLIPKNKIWCRITELTAKAHPTKASKRLVSYRVGYWETEPTPDSPTSTPIVLNVEGIPTELFYVLIDSQQTELSQLEKLCYEDFITYKALGKGYKTELELNRLIDFYDRYPAPRSVIDDSSRKTIVTSASSVVIYRSVDLLSELTLVSETVYITINKQCYSYPVNFSAHNQWLTDALKLHVSPYALKAVNIL